MADFKLISDFNPTGDQPQAIDQLTAGVNSGLKHQTLLGVTGSGKTFTMANVVQQIQRPTLVMAHNKTLAAQLALGVQGVLPQQRGRVLRLVLRLLPARGVHPAHRHVYREGHAGQRGHRAPAPLGDAVAADPARRAGRRLGVAASTVWAIPRSTARTASACASARSYKRDKVLRRLTDIYYERNDYDLSAGKFRVRGDTLEVHPSSQEIVVRISFWGDEVERITEVDPLTGEVLADRASRRDLPGALLRHQPRRSSRRRCTTSRTRWRSRSSSSSSRTSCSKRSGCASAPSTTWRCCARPASARASRTTRGTCRGARRAARRGRCSTTSRTTSCASSTSRT